MKRAIFYAFLATALFTSLPGCEQPGTQKSDSPVIASIDKGTITEDDFLREVGRVPEWARAQFKGEEGKDKFLDEMIKRELIYQHARNMRLHNDEEYLEKVREFEKMTLVSLVLKKEVEEKAFVDETEVKAFYDQNEEKFTIGTELKASHILVETEDEARDLHERITKGESFAELAKEYSKDKGSADKGGDLGFFGRGKMVPEFEKAAASLKTGEVSQPVRTRFGYHIIKLTDIKKGQAANYEQSKESIQRQLLADKRKKFFDAFVDKLKGESSITKNKPAVTAVPLPWDQGGEAEPGALPEGHPKTE